MFDAIINTIIVISWRTVLMVEETGVFGENHRLRLQVTEKTVSYNGVSSTSRPERISNSQR